MSRAAVLWHAPFQDALSAAQTRRHRVLLINLGGVSQVELEKTLWPRAEVRAEVLASSAALLPERLGQESLGLSLSGQERDFPTRLPALAGTLPGGAILALHLLDPKPTPFLRWLTERLTPWAYVLRAGEDGAQLTPPERLGPALTETEPLARDVLATRLSRALTGRPRRPAVLIGARGRGKSSLLGEVAAKLTVGDELVVTGPHPNATKQLRKTAKAGGRNLTHQPPDWLLSQPTPPKQLLIDEAAGLPLPTLLALLEQVPRVVVASTTEGYEGTGQALRHKFLTSLRARWPEATVWTLTTPLRFGHGDPLEAALDDAYGASPTAPESWRPTSGVTRLKADAPAEALATLYQGLREGHYRARPEDLARLFNDPALERWCLGGEGKVQGAMLLKPEGGLPRRLAEAVRRGDRRPGGHHGASIICAQLGRTEGLTLRSLRVARLAVAANARRQGAGLGLLAAARESALAQGQDFLSVSFGATAELLRFWRAGGFRLLRLGHQPRPGSGSPAVLLIAPLSPAAGQMVHGLGPRVRAETRHRLGPGGPPLSPALRLALLGALPKTSELPPWIEEDTARWLSGEVVLEEVSAAVLQRLEDTARTGGAAHATPALEALSERLLLGRPWDGLAQRLQLHGRRETEEALRRALGIALGTLQERSQGSGPDDPKRA
ncbi:MAG: tRNA(Met) cytidine acetyltransferase [Pseudomonadales bacterium]|nr:tRNA(Met) cytidine acetyltransferase [Pseudomonadales bacterium]